MGESHPLLSDADPWYSDLLEKMRASHGRRRISGEFRAELRMCESGTESSSRLPDRIVHIRRPFADGAVKLGRHEARLLLHKERIVLPGLKEGSLVRRFYCEDVQ